jgi:hypothetical protein
MAIVSIRVLVRFEFPSGTVRLWDGSGPYLDQDGNIWKGAIIADGLDTVEQALNGEASTLVMGASAVAPETADIAWQEYVDGDVIGSRVQLLIQDQDEYDQPVGDPEVRFTGTVDNITFADEVGGETINSTVLIECVNRFSLRNLNSGQVISDTDQKARSAILNPMAPPDRIAERIPKLNDKTIEWPRYKS